MDLARLVRTEPSPPPDLTGPMGPGGGVEGNARLTGLAGAALFVILAVEGLTLLQMHQLISWHVFIGMLLVPPVLLKTASTMYRFGHYYRGDPRYAEKGPPHPLLRVTGPLLVLSTLALLGTGIALVAVGRDVGRQYLWMHKATFFVWAALLAVHLLGHTVETIPLATADWRERKRTAAVQRLGGARARVVALVVTLVVGAGLGVVSLGWVGSWHHFMHHLG
ncbi:MAG TPA: hypothetical protein VGU73_04180 [Acidimicrobiia bacterium]|nr:hypothetical protein [Acidimicrobiia bacterium]